MQFLPFKREIDELLICVGFCSPLELQALLVDNLQPRLRRRDGAFL
jgi:hypothetical protein